MKIDENTVRHVALLARLELSDEEVAGYAKELSRILEYVEKLDQLGLESVEPLTELNENTPGLRVDRVNQECLDRDKVLSQAPETDGRYFLVPPVVEYPE